MALLVLGSMGRIAKALWESYARPEPRIIATAGMALGVLATVAMVRIPSQNKKMPHLSRWLNAYRRHPSRSVREKILQAIRPMRWSEYVREAWKVLVRPTRDDLVELAIKDLTSLRHQNIPLAQRYQLLADVFRRHLQSPEKKFLSTHDLYHHLVDYAGSQPWSEAIRPLWEVLLGKEVPTSKDIELELYYHQTALSALCHVIGVPSAWFLDIALENYHASYQNEQNGDSLHFSLLSYASQQPWSEDIRPLWDALLGSGLDRKRYRHVHAMERFLELSDLPKPTLVAYAIEHYPAFTSDPTFGPGIHSILRKIASTMPWSEDVQPLWEVLLGKGHRIVFSRLNYALNAVSKHRGIAPRVRLKLLIDALHEQFIHGNYFAMHDKISLAWRLTRIFLGLSKRPRLLDETLKPKLADIIVVLGTSVGSHLETVIRASTAMGILSIAEANKIMLYRTQSMNPNSRLPEGRVGEVVYRVLGHSSFAALPRHGTTYSSNDTLDILWHNPFLPDGSFDLSHYDNSPPAGYDGFRPLQLQDARNHRVELVGYLGRHVPHATKEELISPRKSNAKLIPTNRAEALQVYALGGTYYEREVKTVRRQDGSFAHVAFLGFEKSLTLAYYQFVESGAVFVACINAEDLRDRAKKQRQVAQKASPARMDPLAVMESGWKTRQQWREIYAILQHPEQIPGFDGVLHQGRMLMDENELAQSLDLFRRALMALRDSSLYAPLYGRFVRQRLPKSNSIESLSEDELLSLAQTLPLIMDELMKTENPELAYDFYRIFPLEQFSELYYLPIVQQTYTEEGLRFVSRYIGEHWQIPELGDVEDASPRDMIRRLGHILGHYPHWSSMLGEIGKLITYDEVRWLEMAGPSATIGNVANPKNTGLIERVRHYPVFQILSESVGRPSKQLKGGSSKPLVLVELSADIAQRPGLQGRRLMVMNGGTIANVLAVLHLDPKEISVTVRSDRESDSVMRGQPNRVLKTGEVLHISSILPNPTAATAGLWEWFGSDLLTLLRYSPRNELIFLVVVFSSSLAGLFHSPSSSDVWQKVLWAAVQSQILFSLIHLSGLFVRNSQSGEWTKVTLAGAGERRPLSWWMWQLFNLFAGKGLMVHVPLYIAVGLFLSTPSLLLLLFIGGAAIAGYALHRYLNPAFRPGDQYIPASRRFKHSA